MEIDTAQIPDVLLDDSVSSPAYSYGESGLSAVVIPPL